MLKWVDRLLVIALAVSALAALAAPYLHANRPLRVAHLNDVSALRKGVGAVDWNGITLEDSISDLASRTHANLVVHWSGLSAALGVRRDQRIRMGFGDCSLETGLQMLLTMVDRETGGSGFLEEDRDGVFHLADRDWRSSEEALRVRAYDVTDLIERYSSQPWNRASVFNSPAGNIFSAGSWVQMTSQEAVDRLQILLETMVDEESWRDNGGQIGTIHYIDGFFVILQTSANQVAVSDVLNGLRSHHRSSQ